MRQFLILAGLILTGITRQAGDGRAPAGRKEAMMIARGTFDVRLSPQADDRAAVGPFSRLILNKQFQGDLQASSKGQMLGAETGQGSGGYVALEHVTGTLNGLHGSFVLQHIGTMTKGSARLDVTVVPDSGTEQLKGIIGTMTIVIEGDRHYYTLEYRIEGN